MDKTSCIFFEREGQWFSLDKSCVKLGRAMTLKLFLFAS